MKNMRKIYKVLSIVLCGMISSNELNAQAINEGFSSVATLTASGWAQQNLSTPVGTSPKWIQGVSAIFPAFSNPDTTYALCTYNSIAGTGTISNWLFAPNRTFSNGDVIKFYSRTVATPAYPDRLELRISLNGASVNAGATSTSVGDFTTLALTINPSLTTAGYPNTWTQYSYTITASHSQKKAFLN